MASLPLADKSNTLVTVKDDTRKCGYSLVHGRGKNIFTTPYTACDVKMLNNFYILRVLYTTLTGERGDIQAKCPVPGLVPREDMPVPVDLGVGGRCAGKPCPGKSNVVKRAAHGHTGLIAVGEGTFLDEPVPHEQMGK
ncbi:UNVERIFIED_CONTAM: hypothetical protein FKN15_066045 [Acipenser sinensis]